jgi:hypothetical protein
LPGTKDAFKTFSIFVSCGDFSRLRHYRMNYLSFKEKKKTPLEKHFDQQMFVDANLYPDEWSWTSWR